MAQSVITTVTKPTPYSDSTHFSDHFAYHITFPFVIMWQSGSCQAHRTATTLLGTWPRAPSCDCQPHHVIVGLTLYLPFTLLANILLPSPLLLSSTFNLYSHSTMFSPLLLSWSPLPFATLPILQFTVLPIIPTPQLTLLSTSLCHCSHHIQHSLLTPIP